jgi:hypothetical protein
LTRVAIAAVLLTFAGCGAAQRSQPTNKPTPLAFAVLRAPGAVEDAVPSWVARGLLAGTEPALSSGDIESARRVLANQQGWLIPAPEDELCLVRVVEPLVSEAGGHHLYPSVKRSCVSQVQAEQGRLYETQSLSTTFAKRLPTRVVGIVPDGVGEVTIHWDGGAAASVPVIRNAYEDVVINPSSIAFAVAKGDRDQRYVVQLPSVAGARPSRYQPRSAGAPLTG